MMNHENIQPTRPSPMAGPLFALRGFLRTRLGVIAMAALAIGGGFYFGWGYVVAAGLAPLIIGVAPCAVMCGLGLCMAGGKKSQDTNNQGANTANLNQIGNGLVNTGSVAGQDPKADASKHGKGCC